MEETAFDLPDNCVFRINLVEGDLQGSLHYFPRSRST